MDTDHLARITAAIELNGCPCFAPNNVANLCAADVGAPRDCALAFTASVSRTDGQHVGFCELRAPMPFATRQSLGMGVGAISFAARQSFGHPSRRAIIAPRPAFRAGARSVTVASWNPLGMGARSVAISGRRPPLARRVAHVIGVGSGEQMGRITTRGIVAMVANKNTRWEVFAVGQDVGDAMGFAPLPANGETAVSVTESASRPGPTRVGSTAPVNAGMESGNRGIIKGKHPSLLRVGPWVVRHRDGHCYLQSNYSIAGGYHDC